MIVIESKRKKLQTLQKKYPTAIFADVTSKSTGRLLHLSPFYPHGGIPVPMSPGYTATCVESIWQGLKVFEHADIDTDLFQNALCVVSSGQLGNTANPSDIEQAYTPLNY